MLPRKFGPVAVVRLCNIIDETLNGKNKKQKRFFLREHLMIIRVYKLAKSEP